MKEADFVVVGAGSAGCVLANRLSADPGNKVVLIEAGGWDRDPLLSIPLLAAINYFRPSLNWGYETEPQANLGGTKVPLPRGRVIGGTSSINGMMYMRGHRTDYQRWSQAGLSGWNFEDVLPLFREFEDNVTHGGDSRFHARSGEVTVVQAKGENPLFKAWLDAALEFGLPFNPDFNGPSQDGAGYNNFNIKSGRRVSSATAFLHPVRGRRNLEVITRAQVTRVLFDGRTCVGVEYRHRGQLKTLRATREVVLSGGTFNSPQLLMLSGIGQGSTLASHGINVVADRPRVGADLQDHVGLTLAWRCLEPVTLYRLYRPDRAVAAVLQAKLFGTGPGAIIPLEAGAMVHSRPGLEAPDLQIVIIPGLSLRPSQKAQRGHFYSCAVVHMRPRSRGYVALRSADPFDKPIIQPNFMSDEDDVRTIREGAKMVRQINAKPALARYAGPEVTPGIAAETDAEIDSWVRGTAASLWHPIGTCRMGADEHAVVDEQLRVRGVDRLRVADASIFPDLMAAGTNIPAMMVGLKAAKLILA